ncbi:MAG: flotillin family protein [Lentisphaeria bacterium]|nr:flotillin family protein [Lentisphaeria bacterium]
MGLVHGIGVVVLIAVLAVFGFLVLAMQFYRKVSQGEALITNALRSNQVSFTGGIVYPVINRAEIMDISVKAIEIERTGKNGLICADNIRADIRVTFYVCVNKTQDDVLRVAQSVGCQRASARDTLEELFGAKFSEALKTVGKQMEFINLFTQREGFKEQIIEVIGQDLNGYRLEDVAIDYLEQTPVESLDDNNVLDSQGIRKITELTALEHMATNEARQNERKVITKQNVEAQATIAELERQRAEAEAKKNREIAEIEAREGAAAQVVEAEERLKSERAALQTEEVVSVTEQNKDREIAVAEKAKERAVAVEEQRVHRERDLEIVERERMVALKTIEKEKAVEIERKNIQEVIRERVMVEKTVAEEEEKIKDTRQIAGAERERRTEVIGAEKEAEQAMVKEVKAAEAKETAAKSLYEEKVTMAEASKAEVQRQAESVRIRAEHEGEAELILADKQAKAKEVLAQGVIAEESAVGLANVKVQEAEASAIELRGKAEANASVERFKAEAFGVEQNGEAEAKAIDLKAAAMKKLDGIGREHEEFKLKLLKQEKVELAGIDVHRQVAEAQAHVLGEAVKEANIDIVGGDGKFLESFFRSISLAKSIDGFVEKSGEAQKLLAGDESNIATQLAGVLADVGISSEDVKNLSLASLLTKMGKDGNEEGASKLRELIGWLAK